MKFFCQEERDNFFFCHEANPPCLYKTILSAILLFYIHMLNLSIQGLRSAVSLNGKEKKNCFNSLFLKKSQLN